MAVLYKNIYKNKREYYRKKKVCHGRYEGMFEWQPMKRFLFFFVPDHTKSVFILDDHGFVPVGLRQRRNHL